MKKKITQVHVIGHNYEGNYENYPHHIVNTSYARKLTC